MNKKFLFFASVILLVSFAAGIFTEITVPGEKMNLSATLPKFTVGIANNIKSDFFTILAVFVFSASYFLTPLVPLMIVGKTFSLGFSAAYILTTSKPLASLSFLFAALLPRGLFKFPAYIALILISFETAVFIRHNIHSPSSLKKGMPLLLKKFFLCFLVLAISSILEILLLQAVL